MIDDCINNICQNGNCIDGENDYSCECLDGYSGDLCDCEGANCVTTSIFQFGTDSLESSSSLYKDSNRNIYILGKVWGYNGYNVSLVKVNRFGELQWNKQFETNEFDYGISIIIDNHDNIYISGIRKISGKYDIFLDRLTANGDIIWEKTWGTSEDDYLRKIVLDNAGNIFLFGDTFGVFENNINRGYSDLFLLKVAPNGERIWTKQWGSFDKEEGKSILLDSNNNIYVTGYKHIGSTVFVTKFDTAGTEKWNKQWITSKIIDKPLVIDSLDNCSILRYENSSLFITKLDDNGVQIGNIALNSEATTIYSSIMDTDNNLYFLGANEFFDIILTKYDNAGNKLFSREWETPETDKAEDFVIDNDYIYITGYTDGILGNNSYQNTDSFLIKTTK